MKWRKMGLVWGPDGSSEWAKNSALQPTPFLTGDGRIRVFAGMRDDNGVSRVGFVDVDAKDPARVIDASKTPVLDVGVPGAFDENGVVPCAVVEHEGELRLFYAGYQLGQKVKFYVFGGMAKSRDGGVTFTRPSRVPVCDRTDEELFFRVIHTMMLDGGRWRAWYGGGDSFETSESRQYPRYNIRHAYSADGVHLADEYDICVDMRGGEYRVGRPYVIKRDGLYHMFYGTGTREEGYRLAYAQSEDGINWTRSEDAGIDVSASGWDSRMQGYPAVITYEDRTYMFYNGNDYGREGFGYALLESW